MTDAGPKASTDELPLSRQEFFTRFETIYRGLDNHTGRPVSTQGLRKEATAAPVKQRTFSRNPWTLKYYSGSTEADFYWFRQVLERPSPWIHLMVLVALEVALFCYFQLYRPFANGSSIRWILFGVLFILPVVTIFTLQIHPVYSHAKTSSKNLSFLEKIFHMLRLVAAVLIILQPLIRDSITHTENIFFVPEMILLVSTLQTVLSLSFAWTLFYMPVLVILVISLNETVISSYSTKEALLVSSLLLIFAAILGMANGFRKESLVRNLLESIRKTRYLAFDNLQNEGNHGASDEALAHARILVRRALQLIVESPPELRGSADTAIKDFLGQAFGLLDTSGTTDSIRRSSSRSNKKRSEVGSHQPSMHDLEATYPVITGLNREQEAWLNQQLTNPQDSAVSTSISDGPPSETPLPPNVARLVHRHSQRSTHQPTRRFTNSSNNVERSNPNIVINNEGQGDKNSGMPSLYFNDSASTHSVGSNRRRQSAKLLQDQGPSVSMRAVLKPSSSQIIESMLSIQDPDHDEVARILNGSYAALTFPNRAGHAADNSANTDSSNDKDTTQPTRLASKVQTSYEYTELMSTVEQWNFDVFKYAELSNGNALVGMTQYVFKRFGMYECFGMDEPTVMKLVTWASRVEQSYIRTNPCKSFRRTYYRNDG